MIQPRWEWRTFGELTDPRPALASIYSPAPVESTETYLLSMLGDASVKVRAGLLDVKVLREVDAAGLQLWIPVLKAPFPVDAAALATAFDALGIPPPSPLPEACSYDELAAMVGAQDDLRVVEVHKSRRRSLLDECMVEYTDVTAGGVSTSTVAVEATDPGLVVRTVAALGLEGRRNTCVAQGLRSMLGWGPGRFAVLDVGTNSVKFVVGERRDGAPPRIELDTAVVTRLGEGLAEVGGLTETAVRRTADAIAALVEDARRSGPVDIAAVGTAGLRQAPNCGELLEAVRARCGVVVEVISGPEEARLAYRAAVSTLAVSGDRLLVFDSGGGSTQFTLGGPHAIDEQFSLDVGAVRFTERFGLAAAVSRETVDEALGAIAADLERVTGRPRPDQVIAIGGTSTNLAAVSHGLATYDADVVHGTVVGVAEIDRQIEAYRQRSADERRGIAGLQPARAEVILAGACIVRTILEIIGQHEVTVSDRGLRHGVVAERFGT